MENIPKKIYLQINRGEKSNDFNKLTKVRCCEDRINDTDIEYILQIESEDELFKILRATCNVNSVLISDVKGERKFEYLMMARREYCYLACELTQKTMLRPNGKSLAQIGAEINKDHATVLYHKRKIITWLNIPAYNLKEKLELIKKAL